MKAVYRLEFYYSLKETYNILYITSFEYVPNKYNFFYLTSLFVRKLPLIVLLLDY